MNDLVLFFVTAIFLVFVIKLAQKTHDKMEKIEYFEAQKKHQSNSESQEHFNKKEDFKQVLQKQNCTSSTKPPYRDYNDKQNLTEYNHGTYRDKKGRYKSKTRWKKEQKPS